VIIPVIMTIKGVFQSFQGKTNKQMRKMRIPTKVSKLSTEYRFLICSYFDCRLLELV